MSVDTCIYCNAREGERHVPSCPAIRGHRPVHQGKPVVAVDPKALARTHEQAARDKASRR